MSDISSDTLAAGRGDQNGKVETSHHPKTDPKQDKKGYYGIPPIKHAHWTWQIPVYFWLGGITAGVALFTAVSKLVGKEDPAVTRLGRYFSVLSMMLSPVLLIWDLGRPERFLNMMRIWKLRSPMSNQSWSLVAYGNVSGILMLKQAAEDGFMGKGALPRLVARLVPDRVLQVLALPLALFIGSNTGTLLSATSVPIWARNWMLMGPTFLASGVSTGLSFISLVLNLLRTGRRDTHHTLQRAEKVMLLAETGLIVASLARMSRWGKPLYTGKVGALFIGCTLLGGIAAPLALLFSGNETRNKSMLTSVLVLLGGLAFRFALVLAGRKSADDPQAYFSFARGDNAPQPGDKI